MPNILWPQLISSPHIKIKPSDKKIYMAPSKLFFIFKKLNAIEHETADEIKYMKLCRYSMMLSSCMTLKYISPQNIFKRRNAIVVKIEKRKIAIFIIGDNSTLLC